MSTYEYGARSGEAGTRVIWEGPTKAGRLSSFGNSLMAGAFEKGPVNRVFNGASKDLAKRVFGKAIRESQANLAMDHFFEMARGAGSFFGLRVTDATERQAEIVLYSRDVDTSYAASRSATKLALPVLRVKAANGGRWGGAAVVRGGKVANVPAAITGSAFDTGLTGANWPFKTDELKGGVLTLHGETRTWLIDGNDAAGIVTVTGDFTGVVTTDGRWVVQVSNIDEDNAFRSLGVVVNDGVADPDDEFDLHVYENRARARAHFYDCMLSSSDNDYFQSKIRESLEVEQYEVTADDEFEGDVTLDESRPANFAEIAVPGGVTAKTVKFRVMNFQVPSGKDGYVGTLVNGGSMVPHKYVLTVLSGAATFSVEAYDLAGEKILGSDLPNGTFGVAYAAPHSFLSGFTVTNGASVFAEADEIDVYVRPLPASLNKLGGRFFPFAFSGTGTGSKDVTTNYRVYSNTYDTITLGVNEDVTAVVVTPGLPTATGATAWDTTKDTSSKTFIFVLNGAAPATLTMTGAATQTIEDAVTELNGLGTDVVFSVATVSGHKYLKVTANDAKYGPAYSLQPTTGTLNAVAGFTNSATVYGAAPTIGRLEFTQEMEGGRDGIANLADAHYIEAFDAEDSPILQLRSSDIGCLKIAMPGVVSVAPQQAMIDFGEVFGAMTRAEVPSTILEESAARAWLKANITPNDFFAVGYPSFGYLTINPFGAKSKYLSTMTGALLGLEARYAASNEGYQKPAADTNALLSPLFSSLPTDNDSGEAVELDNKIINGAGMQEIRHRGPSIFIFGNRIPGRDWVNRWKHQIECNLHILHELLANGDPLAFQITSGSGGDDTRQKAIQLVKSLLGPKFSQAKGGSWFTGASFEDAVEIKADDENNGSSVQAVGDLVCAVSYQIVSANERVTFYIGEKGVDVSVA